MNIQESINKIKEVIYMSDGTKVDYIDINHMDLGGEVSVDVFIEAIETLLTAYEKEKEKNKNLEIELEIKKYCKVNELTSDLIYYKNLAREYQGNCISKDKLKEIVDECIPKKENIITRELEYTPNANANSYLTQEILSLLKEE